MPSQPRRVLPKWNKKALKLEVLLLHSHKQNYHHPLCMHMIREIWPPKMKLSEPGRGQIGRYKSCQQAQHAKLCTEMDGWCIGTCTNKHQVSTQCWKSNYSGHLFIKGLFIAHSTTAQGHHRVFHKFKLSPYSYENASRVNYIDIDLHSRSQIEILNIINVLLFRNYSSNAHHVCCEDSQAKGVYMTISSKKQQQTNKHQNPLPV